MTAPLDLDAIEALAHRAMGNYGGDDWQWQLGHDCTDLVERCRAAEEREAVATAAAAVTALRVAEAERDLLADAINHDASRDLAEARIAELESGLRALRTELNRRSEWLLPCLQPHDDVIVAAFALLEETPDPPDIHVPLDTGTATRTGTGRWTR